MLDSVPSWLVEELEKRCPGFIEHGARFSDPKLIALHLLDWIHNREFGYARRQGWLGALTFYGVRHPLSDCAWAHWEQSETDWNRRQAERYPLFDEWWREALRKEICHDNSRLEVAKAVEAYIGWDALRLWLRPLFRSGVVLPRRVASELHRRCPGVVGGANCGGLQKSQEKPGIWRRLTAWGRDHYLSEAEQGGWRGAFLERLRFHPRHVRLRAYGKHWAEDWSRRRSSHYPSFRQWQLQADLYVTPGWK